MDTLVVAPMQEELDLLVQACLALGQQAADVRVGRLPGVYLPGLALLVAQGGTGKAQFAAQTQHLLDSRPGWQAVICAGAAGALADSLAVGDMVAATETIEHDYRNRFNGKPVPRFPGAPGLLERLQAISPARLHLGPIASGDEDIVTAPRRAELRQATGALAVAWEGAGGARACAFSGVPFLELRGITDAADHHAPASFHANLERAMTGVAAVLVQLMARRSP